MGFISDLFNKKNKEAIQMMLDYVEGRMSINDFKHQFETNDTLISLLKEKIERKYLYWCNYNLYDYIKGQYQYINNWDIIFVRSNLQFILCDYLKYKHYSPKKYEKYSNDYNMMLDMQPSWLDAVDDQGIFDKILEEMPKDISKTKQIAWGKARIKEIFKYDKTYPRWVQGAEWPIVDGKPLVFSHQKKAGKDDERVYYYFYDPDTKEETVITQMY